MADNEPTAQQENGSEQLTELRDVVCNNSELSPVLDGIIAANKRLGEEVERSTKRAKTLIALDKELGETGVSINGVSKDELNTKPVILEDEIEGVPAPVARVFRKLFTVLPEVPPVDLYEKQRLRPSYVLVFLKELAELKIDDAAFKKLDVGRVLNAVHELSAALSARDCDDAKTFADRAIISLRQAVALSSD